MPWGQHAQRVRCRQVVDFSYNSLTGMIPESVGNSLKLRFLYLSGNNFSGLHEMFLGTWLKFVLARWLNQQETQQNLAFEPWRVMSS